MANDFAWALKELVKGSKIRRDYWSEGAWVKAIVVEEGQERHLVMRPTDGSFVAWAPTTADLFADDWGMVQ